MKQVCFSFFGQTLYRIFLIQLVFLMTFLYLSGAEYSIPDAWPACRTPFTCLASDFPTVSQEALDSGFLTQLFKKTLRNHNFNINWHFPDSKKHWCSYGVIILM